ncbi:MAG: ACP S-malonyltransferase [Bdellovibrionaceae bacterium]|nr:ACP S-malonyltransferase [Pseudobdellovibrionaceae bacterium]
MKAVLFPGQGSQHLGMGEFLYKNFKSTKILFEEASDLLHKDFKKLCFSSDEDTLKITTNTQPCLLLVSFSSFSVLKNILGLEFSYLAGHSVGEYAALAASQVMSFSDSLQAVQIRANTMAKAPTGGMTAIMGLQANDVDQLCEKASAATNALVSPANVNSPEQIVISGETKALTWIQENKSHFYKQKKWRAIALKVSSAFHSPLMKKTETAMTEHLNTIDFKDAQHFILPNADPLPIKKSTELKKRLCQQICAPVQWVKTMDSLNTNKIQICVEAGPGKVLSSLMKKTYPQITVYGMNSLQDIKLIEDNFCK